METGRRRLILRLHHHHHPVSYNFHLHQCLLGNRNYSADRLDSSSQLHHPNHLHHRQSQNYPRCRHHRYLSTLLGQEGNHRRCHCIHLHHHPNPLHRIYHLNQCQADNFRNQQYLFHRQPQYYLANHHHHHLNLKNYRCHLNQCLLDKKQSRWSQYHRLLHPYLANHLHHRHHLGNCRFHPRQYLSVQNCC